MCLRNGAAIAATPLISTSLASSNGVRGCGALPNSERAVDESGVNVGLTAAVVGVEAVEVADVRQGAPVEAPHQSRISAVAGVVEQSRRLAAMEMVK